MRKRFEQPNLIFKPILEVQFRPKTRDQLAPILMALQYIFVTPELNEKVFQVLEDKIVNTKNKTGRNGMDLWHILVLGVVRHTRNCDWDSLDHIANYDRLVREVMGVECTGFSPEPYEFQYQTILDNVSLIDEELLNRINEIVVDAGHRLLKKKEEALKIKSDSYVLETNIHFPTDLNLLWDSSRKCLDIVENLQKEIRLKGWRKRKFIYKTIKSQFRSCSQQVFKGRSEKNKKESVRNYLELTENLLSKCRFTIDQLEMPKGECTLKIIILISELSDYMEYLHKFNNLVRRRLLMNEVIPAEEKIYSIFEPHTEWITKGKMNKKVELGHSILITTDQSNLIIDYIVMEGIKDVQTVEKWIERIEDKYTTHPISSHSFDKGFSSKANQEKLNSSKLGQSILPKRGKKIKKKENEKAKILSRI